MHKYIGLELPKLKSPKPRRLSPVNRLKNETVLDTKHELISPKTELLVLR